MRQFVFDDYIFDPSTGEAVFRYHFDGGLEFAERVRFTVGSDYDPAVLDRALFLTFILMGVSYYKTFPAPGVQFSAHAIDDWQAGFLNGVYQEGLSQFAFENNLTRDDLAHFTANGKAGPALPYDGSGSISLQSGGKDSLLVAMLLRDKQADFSSLYVSSGQRHPAVLDTIGRPLQIVERHIDTEKLRRAAEDGGKNGHVPITFIILSIALVQAVLDGKNNVLAAIGHEGEEPHASIGDLAVTHQWSKTWGAEQLFAEYVQRYISPDIHVGSPLRQYSELKIAELFVERAWDRFGHRFSSCNVANYRQGADNTELVWCGECPKCANSYVLFAPFLPSVELQSIFGGKDLFASPSLVDVFKGLLGIDGVMKPFECVGEVDELRSAYHMAQARGYTPLPFEVPVSHFDREYEYPAQMIQL